MVKRLVCNRFIRVVIMGKKDGKALVTMTDESSDPQTNAGELLVTMGYAVVESVQTTENKEPAVQELPQMHCKSKDFFQFLENFENMTSRCVKLLL